MNRVYLNHASETPLRPAVRQRMNEYLDMAASDPDHVPVRPRRIRQLLAQLIGATEGEIALVPNTTGGIGLVAGGLEWLPGDNVVLPGSQFPANMLPWLSLRQRDVEVRLVPPQDGRWTPAALAAQLDGRTRVVAVSSVEFLNGFRGDLPGIGRICRERGILLVVDAIQSAGALPHDVVADQVDVLAAGGYKWLMGPVGTGFLFVRREVQDRIRPLAPGAYGSAADYNRELDVLRLHADARRYEGGNLAWSAYHGWTAALEELLAVGQPAVWQQIQATTHRLIAGLQALGAILISPLEPAARSGIVSFTLGDAGRNEQVYQRLRQAGVVLALRGGYLRVSPHYTSTAAEIDRLLEELAKGT